MSDRAFSLSEFIAKNGWGGAARSPLAGDASARRYERLNDAQKGRAVLMDADPNKGENVSSFLKIAHYLSGIGLSAPQIYAQDIAHGFLIIEDFGDALFARHAPAHPDQEEQIYAAAIDALVALHQHAPPANIKPYRAVMPELAALPYDWYLPGATGQENAPGRAELLALMAGLLDELASGPDVLILRDFHAENLLWLPERNGPARVGLLDFQDAMLGHPAYDLISLIEDARRDTSLALQEAMIARYIHATDQDDTAFRAAAAIIGAQRNLRILGVFARLTMRDGKAHYIDFIPRTWGHLMHDLSHPALAQLREIVLRDLPEPSPEILTSLKAKCAKSPTP
ncbi:MAG: aminoglycoside/choline kinase family phosphotransferase [Halocynthiibacter sp.]|jgi:aminoglycoside/choline kinase family phosphotransferase